MAKTVAKPAAKPNLFARAKEKVEATPKKPKGTTISLPKDLDDKGELTGEAKLLNTAIHDANVATADKKAAETRAKIAKGVLKDYVLNEWATIAAQQGVIPPTPVTVVNHAGETLTYVIQDKTQQNALSPEQVDMFGTLLGQEVAANIIHERTIYSLNPEVLDQEAAGPQAKGESVAEVVCEVLSDALTKCTKLSDDQKNGIIAATSKTVLRRNTFPRIVEICGSNVGKIAAFMEAAGTAVVRYFL
jgi:hypothetical protein